VVLRRRSERTRRGPDADARHLLFAAEVEHVGDYLLDGGQLARPIDVLTFHAYGNREKSIRGAIDAPHAFAAAHGIPEVWMTEFG
jgi:hypothetical protein